MSSSTTGSGVTVAIVDAYASPTIFNDAHQYSVNHDPLHELTQSQFSQVVAPGTYRRPENPRQDPQGWYGEESLDVEAVHGMAPDAKIVYVGSPNNYRDLDAARAGAVHAGAGVFCLLAGGISAAGTSARFPIAFS